MLCNPKKNPSIFWFDYTVECWTFDQFHNTCITIRFEHELTENKEFDNSIDNKWNTMIHL